jgi:hypothetical protein
MATFRRPTDGECTDGYLGFAKSGIKYTFLVQLNSKILSVTSTRFVRVKHFQEAVTLQPPSELAVTCTFSLIFPALISTEH